MAVSDCPLLSGIIGGPCHISATNIAEYLPSQYPNGTGFEHPLPILHHLPQIYAPCGIIVFHCGLKGEQTESTIIHVCLSHVLHKQQ